jgi:hypothetical protein
MARRTELAVAVLDRPDERMVRRLRKASVDRVLREITDPATAPTFWDLVQEVLERAEDTEKRVSA